MLPLLLRLWCARLGNHWLRLRNRWLRARVRVIQNAIQRQQIAELIKRSACEHFAMAIWQCRGCEGWLRGCHHCGAVWRYEGEPLIPFDHMGPGPALLVLSMAGEEHWVPDHDHDPNEPPR